MILQALLNLGIDPRISVALNRMVAAGKLPKTTEDQLRIATEVASKSLCDSIAETFHKVAKGDKEAEVEDEDGDDVEAGIRKDERKVAERTVKLGYAIAKHLGADENTALTASLFAFTQIPSANAVQSEMLEAEWWDDGQAE